MSRDVGVAVQENIDVIWRSIRRGVLQSELQTAPNKINDKRPREIAVAISAHKGDAGSDRLQLVENRFGANITKVPDLIGILSHFAHVFGQTIMRVRENKDAPAFLGFRMRSHLLF